MKFKALLCASALAFAAAAGATGAQAAGGAVLIEDVGNAWGFDESANMTDVFGAGFSEFDYTVNAGTLFSGANSFVMLEGGDGSTSELASFLGSNTSAITSWVSAGGHLLIQSATNQGISVSGVGPGTLVAPGNYSTCGTLTGAGSSAFTFAATPSNQCGNYLAHDEITGSGLTAFMTNDDTGNPIIAGAGFGSGYIMYSGLTTSNFHDAGNSLTDDVIAYTAGAAGGATVPEPSTWGMMLVGLGFVGASMRLARRKTSAAVTTA